MHEELAVNWLRENRCDGRMVVVWKRNRAGFKRLVASVVPLLDQQYPIIPMDPDKNNFCWRTPNRGH